VLSSSAHPPPPRKTVDFITTVLGDRNRRNIDFLTIHPRTRSTPSSVPIFSDALATLTDMFGDVLPIVLSGDVFAPGSLPVYGGGGDGDSGGGSSPPFSAPLDAPPTFPPGTKLAGVMSARGILANPALFSGATACPWDAVEVFMARAARAPLPLKLVVHHLTEMCAPGMGPDKAALLTKAERAALVRATNMLDVVDLLDAVARERMGRDAGMRRDAVGPRLREGGGGDARWVP
jgi:tRNA-dihydrouridine synthase 4